MDWADGILAIELTSWKDKENRIACDQLDHFGVGFDDIELELGQVDKAEAEVAEILSLCKAAKKG